MVVFERVRVTRDVTVDVTWLRTVEVLVKVDVAMVVLSA